MANKQISQLTAKPTPVASTDQFGIDDNSSDSWKITVANLQTYFTALYLTLSGGTMTGNLILNGDPSTNLMAATKQYVDSVASGLNIQPSCRVATTAALTVTYNNGASGIGSTITNAGAQAALSIDSVTLSVNDRVLVKDQASTLQNGIYTVTNVGSGATNWVMTRATDYDTAAEITPGDFVLVLSGTANGQTQWVETATVTTVGTDPIVWNQFGADIHAVITAIQNNSYVYSEDTGVADAYVATLSPAPSAYVEGMLVILDVANANTGASTINVNSLGLKNIVTEQNGTLQAGDLIAGRRAWLLYDGTSFRLVNRNIEKRLQNESFNYILDTGAADAYVATLVPAVTAYVAGLRISLKIANTNTTTSTLNVNGLGTKTIKTTRGDNLWPGALVTGMIADLRYDGTNFQLLNPVPVTTVQTYSSGSGTYNLPAGCRRIKPKLWGAGGGGGGAANTAAGGGASGTGGDGGGYCEKIIDNPSSSYSYAVGAAGTGATAGNNSGGNGGDTTFGTLTASGGGGGGGGAAVTVTDQLASTPAFAPGTGTNGDVNITGGYAGYPAIFFGAGAQVCGNQGGDGAQGASGGHMRLNQGTGLTGNTPGGGGGGGVSINAGGTAAGGPGGAGYIEIEQYFF